MTNNNKKSLTLEEVAQAREVNTPKVFNLVAALKAAEAAPAKATQARAGGAVLSVVREILGASEASLTMNQIQAAYFAGTNTAPDKKIAKKVYEAVFQHSDACNNKGMNKARVEFTRDANGAYSMIKA